MFRKTRYLTCTDCGWVFYAVTLNQANKEIDQFNSMYFRLPAEKQKSYYGGISASIEGYTSCHCGNHYSNFRDSVPDEIPGGSTVNPILHYNEVLPALDIRDSELEQEIKDYAKNTFKCVTEPSEDLGWWGEFLSSPVRYMRALVACLDEGRDKGKKNKK